MGFSFFKVLNGLNIIPKATPGNSQLGDLEVLTGTNQLFFHNGSTSEAVTTAGALTNVVEGSGTSVTGDIATYADTTGLLIQDPGLNFQSNTLKPSGTDPLLVKAGDGGGDGQNLTLRGGDGSGLNGVGGQVIIQPGTAVVGHGINSTILLYDWQGDQGWEIDNGGNYLPINDNSVNLGLPGQMPINIYTYALQAGTSQELSINNSGDLSTTGVLQVNNLTVDASGNLSTTGTLQASTGGDFTVDSSGNITSNSVTNASFEQFHQIATPSNPPSNNNKLYFKSDNNAYTLTSGGSEAKVLTSAMFTAPTVQSFTSGSGTYTRPSSPTPLYLKIKMVGSGGGGAGGGSSGAGDGTTGTDTTFGSLTAGKGIKAVAGNMVGAAGGTGTIGMGSGFTIAGGQGGAAQASGSVTYSVGAMGGISCFGGNGSPATGGNSNLASAAATNCGAGGAGGNATTTSSQSGAGGGAGAYVEAIVTSPSATYSYVVGAAGTGGAAGITGGTGAAGGSGIIIVEEYYQ